ncbi:MAG: hypothetical protein JXB07_07245 [Anaerolineae bacterium]|nr:hypothetical protein [Anaerolineae bacterium]
MRRARRAANIRQMTQTSPRVELVVDDLVLIGCSASERYAIGDAFSSELERMLSGADSRQTFQHSAELPALDAGSIAVSSQRRPGSIGAQVAQAVYGSLTAGSKGGKR